MIAPAPTTRLWVLIGARFFRSFRAGSIYEIDQLWPGSVRFDLLYSESLAKNTKSKMNKIFVPHP
jgi:hypothetical protein